MSCKTPNVSVTGDGKSFAGVFKEETNRTLTLVQSDGQPVGIEKASIVKRESVHQSVMPAKASPAPTKPDDDTLRLVRLGSHSELGL